MAQVLLFPSVLGVRQGITDLADALTGAGDIEVASPGFGQRGRGRPAKYFQLTASGRGKMRHAYDDLAGAAMRKLRDLGGTDAVAEFARSRVARLEERYADELAERISIRSASLR